AADTDRGVTGHKADGEGRHAGQQQGDDQGRLAPDAVAVMAEDRRADRAAEEADGVYAESLQRADQRIGGREVQFSEGQRCDQTVKQEIVRLDHSPDGARDDCAAQLRAVLSVRQTCVDEFGCTHHRSSRFASPNTLRYRGQCCCPPMLTAVTQREKHSVRRGWLCQVYVLGTSKRCITSSDCRAFKVSNPAQFPATVV